MAYLIGKKRFKKANYFLKVKMKSRNSPADQPLLPSLAAFLWHLGDAFLSVKSENKKARKVWAGVGVGWSAFMISMILLAKAKQEWYNSNSERIKKS